MLAGFSSFISPSDSSASSSINFFDLIFLDLFPRTDFLLSPKPSLFFKNLLSSGLVLTSLLRLLYLRIDFLGAAGVSKFSVLISTSSILTFDGSGSSLTSLEEASLCVLLRVISVSF